MHRKFLSPLLVFFHLFTQSAFAIEFQPAFIKAIPVSISPINKIPLNEENRLIYANNPAHTSIIYMYDAFNRRISKTVDGNSIFYIHDGDQIVEERDASGNLNATFLYGNGIDEILLMYRAGNLFVYHHDALGSVDAIVDWAGNPAEFTLYDVYGNPSTTNSSIGNPFLFTGRQYDPETGLYYYRNRMYDPTLGRFLQRDPIGYADSMNLYGYTKNNPVNFVDPYGLYSSYDFLRDASNFSAGFGDFVTFGATNTIRDMIGDNTVVDHCSDSYDAGGYTAMLAELALGGASIYKALGKETVEITTKVTLRSYSEATLNSFKKQLEKNGIKSLVKSKKTIEKNLADHLEKLVEIQKIGGRTSSVEREIRTFQKQLEAINSLL